MLETGCTKKAAPWTTSQQRHLYAHLLHCRVDYCNTLLAGATKVTTDKLQRVLNAAARVPIDTQKFDRGLSRLLHTELHWLTYLSESHTSSESSCSAAMQHGRAPQYFDRLLSTNPRCGVTAAPSFSQSTSSGRAASPSQHARQPGFAVAGPMVWHSLPNNLRKTLL